MAEAGKEMRVTYREDRNAPDERSDGLQRALIGATAVAAAAGAAFFIGSRIRANRDEPYASDAPSWTRRGEKGGVVGRTVTIDRPKQELYAFWRDFTNLPRIMDNVRSVVLLDDKRSHWTIEAPGGGTVEFDSRITEDVPGSLIAWESEEGADIRNCGRVGFMDAAPGRGTLVRVTIDYDPPGGAAGRALAKLLQREPNVQARRDLRRFKQLMETGEVASSAGPSGRKSEDPTKQYI